MKCGMCMLISTRACEGCEEDSKFYPSWEEQTKEIRRLEIRKMRQGLAIYGGLWWIGVMVCGEIMYRLNEGGQWWNNMAVMVYCVGGAVWIAWMSLRISDRKVGV